MNTRPPNAGLRVCGHRITPFWSVLLVAIALWGATCCSGAEAVDWVGRSREEVVTELGRPQSALQRGDTEVLMYPNSVRIEIRNDVVVAYRAGSGAMIVASDGTRYTPTDKGRVQRVVEVTANEEEDDEPVVAELDEPVAAPAIAASESDEAAVAAETEAADDAAPADAAEDEGEEDGWSGGPGGDLVEASNPHSRTIEDIAEHGLVPDGADDEEAPPWANTVTDIVGALLRFGFAVLMLRVAISWVELPCYMPDVMKVAALYTVIREGMHGLGRLGGHWEWVLLFKLDDVVSFFALMILLYKFKVALSGITALKIAIATKGATFLLMAIFMTVIAFAFGTLF